LEEKIKEAEELSKEIAELTTKNHNFLVETDHKAKETIELEKKLTNNVGRTFNNRAKNNSELDKMVEVERKRAQESLDYVRGTLKDRISALELQLKAMDSTTDSRREKRRIERELKQVTRSIEHGNEQTAANARGIESLEKQLSIVKSRAEKLTLEKAQLQKEAHKLDQNLRDLKSRLETTNEINAKFNASVPLEVSTAFEEDALSNEKRI